MTEQAFQIGAMTFHVRDLGAMAYAEALALQKSLQQAVIASRGEGGEGGPADRGYLLLVEHDPPVITMTRRKGVRDHLVASAAQLAAAGVQVAETDRGGDITYHGPGQLVIYPIVDLNVLNLRLHGYMRFLEQIVIDTLATYGIIGARDESATGVWVGRKGLRDEGTEGQRGDSTAQNANAQGLLSLGSSLGPSSSAKICAMGVRISRWVSMHGLALNITTNLDHFDLIVPCGLAGRAVTSMRELLGASCPPMNDVKAAMIEQFREAIESRA
jgi:lipoyl(octanoyl) transferase